MKKDVRVNLRLTLEQNDQWSLVAKENEISLAELIRRSVESFMSGQSGMTKNQIDAIWELAEQIRRVGVNLNELVLKIHQDQIPADLNNQIKEVAKNLKPLLEDARKKINHGRP